MKNKESNLLTKISLLNEVGIALSAEKNFPALLEQILIGAKKITNADGGTIYLLTPEKKLEMVVVQTDSLDLHLGINTNKPITFKPISLYHENEHPNLSMVVTQAVIEDRSINITDAYNAEGYDFSGTYQFDKSIGYHSKSLLAVPMKNHENEIIGVLQLINSQSMDGDEIVAFDPEEQRLIESLTSQAAVAITNKQLIDCLNELFNSLIQLIATAIDEKSPYTSGHCKRLPQITMMLAEAAHKTNEGELKSFNMTNDDRYELEVAAWLHDCGKLTTPEIVMDKSTKLEKVVDRIELVYLRTEVMKRDIEIERLVALANGEDKEDKEDTEQRYNNKAACLKEICTFLRHHNKGAEFMSDEDIQKVQNWAQLEWVDNTGKKQSLLTQDEMKNLCIRKGTLTQDERNIINNHIVATIKMLDTLTFPKHLQNVPEYAGGHHERVDGKGFPNGLKKHEMSVQARIMAIADVFEALTAKDRPYKDPMKLSQAISILRKMSETGHIDPDLFAVFINESVHVNYAKEYLLPEQIDL